MAEAEVSAERAPVMPPEAGVLDSASSVSAMVVVGGVVVEWGLCVGSGVAERRFAGMTRG